MAHAQSQKDQHVVFPSTPVKSPTGSIKQSAHRDREREREQRERDPRAAAQAQAPSPAAASLAKVAGGATPRRREKKSDGEEPDIVRRLQQICTDGDPTKLYRNLVRIGQG